MQKYYDADYIYLEEDEKEIKELLLYRKIVKVEGDRLYLDNGTELEVYPNVGCSGCGSGKYDITELNDCNNVITNVEFVCDDNLDEFDYNEKSYKIFVYTEDKRIKILQVDGMDGNGWYGTGYKIYVRLNRNS